MKNKSLKSTKSKLEKEILELKEMLSRLEKGKEIVSECKTCKLLKIENEELKEEASKLNKFEKSTHSLRQLIGVQKASDDKTGIGYNFFEASPNISKQIKFVKSQSNLATGDGPSNPPDGPSPLKDRPTDKGPSPVRLVIAK